MLLDFFTRDRSSAHPGHFDVETAALLFRTLGPVCRHMWPGIFHGLSKLPSHNQFIVVANHSGMGSAELWSLFVGWHERFGTGRPVAGMAHPAAFRLPFLRPVLQGLGAVEATQLGACKARLADVPLLIFPGGDHEAMRPYWQGDRVDFAGRKGWIRLARKHGLTIVPMAIVDSHRTLPVVAGGKTLAWLSGLRLLGVRRGPLPLLSLLAALSTFSFARSKGAGLAAAYLSADFVWLSTVLVPWIPSAIEFHLLDPIEPSAFHDSSADDVFYDDVVGRLQRVLDERTDRGGAR